MPDIEKKYETAFKMFNSDLTCTLGRGIFRFEPGVWYEEKESNCRKNGFHAAKNPLDCLSYYRIWEKSQCWLVELDGTVDEDETDSKVSATRIRLVRRLNLLEFAVAAGQYIIDHPMLKNSAQVHMEAAEPDINHFSVCRGKNPRSRGRDGDILIILKEEPDTQKIEAAGCWVVSKDGNHQPGIWYNVDGEAV